MKNMVLLRSVHWKILWETKKGFHLTAKFPLLCLYLFILKCASHLYRVLALLYGSFIDQKVLDVVFLVLQMVFQIKYRFFYWTVKPVLVLIRILMVHHVTSRNISEVWKPQKRQNYSKDIGVRAHLDGVYQSHESQAAEVDVKSVTERPDQVVVWWLLAHITHVDHRGAASLSAGFTVSERSAVVHVAVCGVIHPRRSGVNTPGRSWRGITEEKDQDTTYTTLQMGGVRVRERWREWSFIMWLLLERWGQGAASIHGPISTKSLGLSKNA